MTEEVTEWGSLENLELRAIEQRHRMHETAEEFRGKVAAGRERLDVKNNLREHFTAVALASSLIAMGMGFSAGGMLRRRQDGERA
jgi:hypothetical protein